MKCSCNGVCRENPYVCPVTYGYYARAYDPDWGRNMRRFTVSQSDIMDTYRKKTLDTTVRSVVKD